MFNIITALKTRRSIRKYTSQPVPVEAIREILEVAAYAPSAHNVQPWRFIVLTEAEAKRDLAETMAQVWLKEMEQDHVPKTARLATVHASVEKFTAPPVLIVGCLAMEDLDKYPNVERQQIERDLAVQSVAAAIQNLLLAAHASGLGACWYCAPSFCRSAVRQSLGLPNSVEPQALITLGYPDETPKAPQRHPLETYAYKGKWASPFKSAT